MIKKTVNVSLAVLTMICALGSVAAAKGALGIGTVTWHAAKLLGKNLVLTGYVLVRRRLRGHTQSIPGSFRGTWLRATSPCRSRERPSQPQPSLERRSLSAQPARH